MRHLEANNAPGLALRELPSVLCMSFQWQPWRSFPLGHGKQLITCFPQEAATPEAGTRVGARAQHYSSVKGCSGLLHVK